MRNPLLVWESALTFATVASASLSLASILPDKDMSLVIIMVQALNAATVVYKTGQWNPNPQAVPPITVAPVIVSTKDGSSGQSADGK